MLIRDRHTFPTDSASDYPQSHRLELHGADHSYPRVLGKLQNISVYTRIQWLKYAVLLRQAYIYSTGRPESKLNSCSSNLCDVGE